MNYFEFIDRRAEMLAEAARRLIKTATHRLPV